MSQNTGRGGSGSKGGTYKGAPIRTGSKGSGGTGRSQGSKTGNSK